MGADIHSFAEVRRAGKWERVTEPVFPYYGDKKTTEPFGWRSYSVFGFLANVRNYAHCTPIIPENRGLPLDSEFLNGPSEYGMYERDLYFGMTEIPEPERGRVWTDVTYDANYHSLSWLTLKELLDFDYDKTFWNRRISKQIAPNVFSGAELAQEGEGTIISYRDHLGTGFFQDLDILKSLGALEDVRVIFWFDN